MTQKHFYEKQIRIVRNFQNDLSTAFPDLRIDLKIINLKNKKALQLETNIPIYELLKAVRHHNLFYKNATREENVYWAPSKCKDIDLLFLDDPLPTPQNLADLLDITYIQINTSHLKQQNIIKLTQKLEIAQAQKIQSELIKKYNADTGASNLFHFRRMPGFHNTKYSPTFLVTYTKLSRTLQTTTTPYQEDKINQNTPPPNSSPKKPQKTKYDWEYFYNFETIGKDKSRADLLYAMYLYARGYSPEEIKKILLQHSRDIQTRKKHHLDDYLNRTVYKAQLFSQNRNQPKD